MWKFLWWWRRLIKIFIYNNLITNKVVSDKPTIMKHITEKMQQQFDIMCATGKLFESSIPGSKVWKLYLESFNPEDDPIFRDPESSTHNCNHCHNFVKRYGNIVAVVDGKIVTMFDGEVDLEYSHSFKAMSKALKAAKIGEVFFETFNELNSLPYESCSKKNNVFRLGVDKNVKRYTKEEADKFGKVKANDTFSFEHMHLSLPKQFVDMTGSSVESIRGNYRDNKNVFQRAMIEIPLDTLNLVRDLIIQGSLLNGDAHLSKVEAFIPFKQAYDALSAAEQDTWCWVTSYGLLISKFKNELIGVLCTELAEGKELNEACQAWNKRVDPANYMKATAPITKKQVEEAQKFVEENGYGASFDRRFATIDDIKVTEIKHINVGNGELKAVSIFDKVKPATSTRHKRSEFEGVEEVAIDKFMSDILPNCTSVEALLQNDHEGNMVSLTTANDPECKQIFKWNNPYSWTFKGNIAGKSEIKDNVKAAGGKITGELRCSLQWNDEDTKGVVDLDLHCMEETCEINYANKVSRATGGFLDVDMIRPSTVGIENITWQKKMKDGVYEFFVRNYCGGANKGFKAEIEFGGNTFNYQHSTPLGYKANVRVATVTVKNGEISIKHHLAETNSSREIYGLETNNFHRVNLVCLSPNHWDGNDVGNKHYFFMLEGAKTSESIRSFHNENLTSDLLAHRKVLEVLGATHMLPPAPKQLTGLGFNATVNSELIVKLGGSFKRVVKIKF